MKPQTLTTSEVNSLIAALLLTSLSYEKSNKTESHKYKKLENKLRTLCYRGEEVRKLQCWPLYPNL